MAQRLPLNDSFLSTDSDILDLDLAQIEHKIHHGKRGHVTYAGLKVISLIGAWATTVLLGFTIAAIIAFLVFIPNDIGVTLNNGILFLRSISDGYELALQNLPPSMATSELKEDFSNFLQTFYAIPFPKIRSIFDVDFVNKLFPILAEIPLISYDVQDMLWSVRDILGWAFFFTAPAEFLFPSHRYYPFTLIFEDKHNNYSLNSEFVDTTNQMFPGVYVRSTTDNQNRSIKHILNFDQHWQVHQVLTSVQPKNFTQNINLTTLSLQYYDPISNEFIILDATNQNTSPGFSLQQTVQWNQFDYMNESVWSVHTPYNQTYHNIELGFLSNSPPNAFGVSQFLPNEIKLASLSNDTNSDFNGVYRKIHWRDHWKSNQYFLYNSADRLDGLSTYIKINKTHKYHWTLYKLSYERNSDTNINELKLSSHQITKLYESQGKNGIEASIDTVKWNKLNIAKDRMEAYKDISAETKTQSEWQAPNIEKVILKYKRKESNDIMSTALCLPYVKFEEELFYFKLRTERKRIDHIIADWKSVNVSDCVSKSGYTEVYLRIDALNIKSEVLGGNVIGTAHVFFRDQNACDKWRDLYSVTVRKMKQSSAQTKRKNEKFLKREAKTIKSRLRAVLWPILEMCGIL